MKNPENNSEEELKTVKIKISSASNTDRQEQIYEILEDIIN